MPEQAVKKHADAITLIAHEESYNVQREMMDDPKRTQHTDLREVSVSRSFGKRVSSFLLE